MVFRVINTDKSYTVRDVAFSNERLLVCDFNKAVNILFGARDKLYPKYAILRPFIIIRPICDYKLSYVEEKILTELGMSSGRQTIICQMKNPSDEEILSLAKEPNFKLR